MLRNLYCTSNSKCNKQRIIDAKKFQTYFLIQSFFCNITFRDTCSTDTESISDVKSHLFSFNYYLFNFI